MGPRPIQLLAILTVPVVLARTRTNEWACCVNHHGRLETISREHAPTEPPTTDRKVLPARPSRKRETSIVAMFFATAKSPGPISLYTNWGKARTDHEELTK